MFRWYCLVDANKEFTIAIIKPDAVKAGLAESIIQEVRTLFCHPVSFTVALYGTRSSCNQAKLKLT